MFENLITKSEAQTLFFVLREGKTTVKEIAENLKKHKSSVSRDIQNLLDKNMIIKIKVGKNTYIKPNFLNKNLITIGDYLYREKSREYSGIKYKIVRNIREYPKSVVLFGSLERDKDIAVIDGRVILKDYHILNVNEEDFYSGKNTLYYKNILRGIPLLNIRNFLMIKSKFEGIDWEYMLGNLKVFIKSGDDLYLERILFMINTFLEKTPKTKREAKELFKRTFGKSFSLRSLLEVMNYD